MTLLAERTEAYVRNMSGHGVNVDHDCGYDSSVLRVYILEPDHYSMALKAKLRDAEFLHLAPANPNYGKEKQEERERRRRERLQLTIVELRMEEAAEKRAEQALQQWRREIERGQIKDEEEEEEEERDEAEVKVKLEPEEATAESDTDVDGSLFGE